jgi:hypothetical protein
MANDRGGMPRGGVGDPWGQGPGSRRMPAAPRERRPLLAGLALLLVVGGAAASGYLAFNANKKVAAIEIATKVVQGQPLTLADMQEEEISGAAPGSYVAWAFRDQVAGNDAATTIPAGTLLVSGMTQRPNSQQNNGPQVGLNVKAGQIPANLQPGDSVDIVALVAPQSGNGSGSSSSSAATCPASSTDQILSQAVVNNVAPDSSGDGANVTLSMPAQSNTQTAAYIAGCASDQLIALVYLPEANGTG